jgi:hypothetical protein
VSGKRKGSSFFCELIGIGILGMEFEEDFRPLWWNYCSVKNKDAEVVGFRDMDRSWKADIVFSVYHS